MRELLWRQGARSIAFPTIDIVPPDSWQALDTALERLASYTWIVFTSANGVRFFFRRLREIGRDLRDLKDVRICTIGPATAAAIEGMGVRVDLVPDSYISEGVVRAFEKHNLNGLKVLLPRAETARDVIPDGLSGLGAAASEDERVAALEPGHDLPLSGFFHKAAVDLVLRQGMIAALFAGVDQADGMPGVRKEFLADQVVVDQDVRFLDAAKPLEGNEFRVARAGAAVDVVPVYRTVASDCKKEELAPLLAAGEVDVVTFTSPSTVTHFMDIMGEGFTLPPQVRTACIGPVTAAALKKAGLPVSILREEFTIPGLVAAMIEYYQGISK
jgi:uroporphyrinogen-III synthase